jgi:hypothetical protein
MKIYVVRAIRVYYPTSIEMIAILLCVVLFKP